MGLELAGEGDEEELENFIFLENFDVIWSKIWGNFGIFGNKK